MEKPQQVSGHLTLQVGDYVDTVSVALYILTQIGMLSDF